MTLINNQETNILLLTRYFSLSLYSDWLILSEVCELDTSLCNAKLRPVFLQLLNYAGFSFVGLELSVQSYYRWLAQRNISVKYIELSEYVVADESTAKYLEQYT